MNQIWSALLMSLALLGTLSSLAGGSELDEAQRTAAVDFITVEELKTRVISNEPVMIIDVRGSESYANSTQRIKGAIHISVRKLKYRLSFAPLKDVPKDRTVVTYCACQSDEASLQAAQILQESGFKNVRALKGGWNEWQKARGPVEPRPRG